MQRRTVLRGCAPILAVSGCLELRPTGDGDGGSDGGGGATSGDDGEFYETGTMDVRIDGDSVDLSADRFQSEYADEDVRFHFHEGDENWHMERERVTFATAVDVLPEFAYSREDGDHVLTVDGTTYDGGAQGTDISFAVDGDPVDPTDYDVQGGDHLAVVVTTDG